RRDGEVLLYTGQIAESDIDVFDILIRHVLDDLVGRAERHLALLTDRSQPVSSAGRRDPTVWTGCFPAVKGLFRQCYTCRTARVVGHATDINAHRTGRTG